jgi:beta-lactamase regulating signal transducer with metallopeptidase domain
MFIWMFYVIAVSVLLGCAAWAAERGARLGRGTTRWYWLAAILASLLVPTVIASVSVQMPDVVGIAAGEKILVLRNATTIPLTPLTWLVDGNESVAHAHSVDQWLKSAWLLVSFGMLLVLVVNGMQLYRRKRIWRRAEMRGAEVFVVPDVGPAVVGFLRPCIVVPTWLVESAPRTQASVMAHERAHLDAGDPQLFTIALCLLVLMPWNLPLWWQLRRLRYAIEVDCDARVIGGGTDAADYGETLIAVGERQSGYLGAVAAMSESPSFLEQRIKIMVSKRARFWLLTSTALGCLSVALVAVAAQVSPPNAQTVATAEPATIALDANVLDRYTGHYKLSDSAVMTVTRTGTQLSAKITGQPAVEIYPDTSTHFFYRVVKADVDFVADGLAPATAMTLHQNGSSITMPRIDAGTAQLLESNLSARVQLNQPSPGTEAALRNFIQRREAGLPVQYETMSPEMATAMREQMSQADQIRATLGKLQSIQFQGVGAQGYDTYTVKYENVSMIYRIQLDQRGIITGMSMTPL